MKRIRALVVYAVLLFGAPVGTVGEAIAGHPLGTEDAGTQGRGNVEIEFNLEQRHDNEGTKTTSPGNRITMGIGRNIDLAVGYAYDFARSKDGETSRGMGPVEIAVKTAVIEGTDGIPTLGIKGGFSLPAAEGDQTALHATAIAEWPFEPLTIFVNAGTDVGTRLAGNAEKTTSVRASTAGSYELGRKWFLLSELLWEKPTSPSAPPTVEWLVGGMKETAGSLRVDAGVRWGLTRESPHVTYLVGLTLGFHGGPPVRPAETPPGERR